MSSSLGPVRVRTPASRRRGNRFTRPPTGRPSAAGLGPLSRQPGRHTIVGSRGGTSRRDRGSARHGNGGSPMVDHTVRAMTGNSWWRFGPHWDDRQPGIRETLARVSPAVVPPQEVWAGGGRTQAHQLAAALQMHAVFAAPSYPPAPADPDAAGGAGFELGIAVLSRWPVLDHDAPVMPARHRGWDPVALAVRVDHPAGPLPVVAACLEYAVAYTDDRVSQGAFLAGHATDPRFDGACPVLLMGD